MPSDNEVLPTLPRETAMTAPISKHQKVSSLGVGTAAVITEF